MAQVYSAGRPEWRSARERFGVDWAWGGSPVVWGRMRARALRAACEREARGAGRESGQVRWSGRRPSRSAMTVAA